MKKIFFTAAAISIVVVVWGQQQQGMITYRSTIQMQGAGTLRVAGGREIQGPEAAALQKQLDQPRISHFELLFGNNKTLWQSAIEQPEAAEPAPQAGNTQIRLNFIGGDDAVMYTDLTTGLLTEQRELNEKKYLIRDTVMPLKWKIEGITKTVLGYTCQKATAIRYGKRMVPRMQDGKFEEKEVADTTSIIAWFTGSIPVAAGPASFQKQLPGMILEMDINNGRQVYTAVAISSKVAVDKIREPSGKTRISRAAFKAEMERSRKRMMEQFKNTDRSGNIHIQAVGM
ncbi:GLPGLI family protein [Niabella beijingensis]|uniref:GLPGLI family protein n=1 Tax=Niabella beijingensis TaxID=2872700 RepID=UPI001CBEFD0D|nr:GLPGLI family protein [Niabella beijingensis]MBZ4192562.1 GLPGLI family protein [Niabella beijingensis]